MSPVYSEEQPTPHPDHEDHAHDCACRATGYMPKVWLSSMTPGRQRRYWGHLADASRAGQTDELETETGESGTVPTLLWVAVAAAAFFFLMPKGDTKKLKRKRKTRTHNPGPASRSGSEFKGAWAARQRPPKGFVRYRTIRLAPGVSAIVGYPKGARKKAGKGRSKIQSLRFSKRSFTEAKAKRWLKDHGFKTGVV